MLEDSKLDLMKALYLYCMGPFPRKVKTEAELHVARFLKKFESVNFDFKKNLKTIMVVDNIVIHHYENFYS